MRAGSNGAYERFEQLDIHPRPAGRLLLPGSPQGVHARGCEAVLGEFGGIFAGQRPVCLNSCRKESATCMAVAERSAINDGARGCQQSLDPQWIDDVPRSEQWRGAKIFL